MEPAIENDHRGLIKPGPADGLFLVLGNKDFVPTAQGVLQELQALEAVVDEQDFLFFILITLDERQNFLREVLYHFHVLSRYEKPPTAINTSIQFSSLETQAPQLPGLH